MPAAQQSTQQTTAAPDLSMPASQVLGAVREGSEADGLTIVENDGPTAESLAATYASGRQARLDAIAEKYLPEAPEANAAPPTPAAQPAADAPIAESLTAEAAAKPAEAPAALDKIKAAATRARQAYRAQQRRQSEFEQLRSQKAAAEAEAARYREQGTRGASLIEKLANPATALSAIREAGLSADLLVQEAIKETSPEAKLDKLARALEQSDAARKALEDRLTKKDQAAAQKAAYEKTEQSFVEAAANAERYPNLAGLDADVLLAIGEGVAQKARARYFNDYGIDRVPTHAEILSYVDKKLGSAKKPAAAPPEPQTSAATPKTPAATGTSKKPSIPRTTTNSMSAALSSLPPDFRNMSRTDRIRILSGG